MKNVAAAVVCGRLMRKIKILHCGGENLAPLLQNKTEIFGIR